MASTSQPGLTSVGLTAWLLAAVLWVQMAFRNVTLVSPAPCINLNDTRWLVASLLSEAKWVTGIDVLPDGDYVVREMFNGTYPVRDIASGGSGGHAGRRGRGFLNF